MARTLLIVLFLCGCYLTLFSATPYPAVKDTAKKNFIYRFFNQAERHRYQVYPVAHVTYDAQTSFKFGADCRLAFKIGKDAKNLSSYIDASFYYTILKQTRFLIASQLYFNKNMRLTFQSAYKKFPDSFYGVGNHTKSEDKENFNIKSFQLKVDFLRRILGQLYFGGTYEFERSLEIEHGQQGLLAKSKAKGYNGFQVSGAGFVAQYDTRNSSVFPTSGENVELSVVLFAPFFKSDDQMLRYDFRFRKYILLSKKNLHILAMDCNLIVRDNSPPFVRMSSIGEEIRGYNKNRYIDQNRIYGQLEYRFPIYWRFRGGVFFGVGDVFDQFADLSLSRLKFAGGGGIRVILDPKERISIRFDYAVGKDWITNYYLGINEAF